MTASKGFQPGVSGNPAGRSKKDLELEAHARLHAKHAIDVAAQLILDRGHGKPKEQVTVTHERPVTEWTEEQLDAVIAGLAGEARKGEGSSKSH